MILLSLPTRYARATDESIAPDSWVYPALRTFELEGLVRLDPSIPYSRSDVEGYVKSIRTATGERPKALTPRTAFLLRRLEEEFLVADPRQRENSPMLFLADEERFAALDLSAGALFIKTAERDEGDFWGTARPRLLVGFEALVTIETAYSLKMGPEEGTNAPREKPNPRERSFRGLTSEFERGMIFLTGVGWRLGIGRDYVHWGSGREEGLLVSRTAGSFDHLTARLTLGPFRLHALHAVLDQELPRRLAGHRLTMRLPRGISLGVGETVVYTGRGVDFAYLLPFGSYYANQYNETDDDNILWGIDWRVPIARGLICYGEFLVDDFQYESDPPAPDRIGINATAEYYLVLGGQELELLLGYTYIDIYTYAHKDSLSTSYVTGDGDPEANSVIGSTLGPDADRWNAAVRIPVHPRLLFTVRGSYTRRGEGNDLTEWIPGMEAHPEFPSGEVTRERKLSFEADLDLDRGSYIRAAGGWVEQEGRDIDDVAGFLHLELVLDF